MAFTWFPGHMRKALRRIEADALLVDLVLLLLDARAPATSRNATLERTLLGRGKRLLFVLSKADMADPAVTQAWVRNLQSDGQDAVAISGATGAGRAGLLQALRARHKVSLDVARRRGIQHAMLRCMVVGVPNVGKSTLINKLAGSARAKAGKRPGVTRGPQWVQLADGIELLDTPGVMLPGRLGPESLLSLAVTGTIKEEVLPLDGPGARPGGADPGSGLRLTRVWRPAPASRRGTLARVAAGALPGSGFSPARQRARRAPRRPVSAQSPAGRPMGTVHPGAPRGDGDEGVAG